MSDDRTDGEFVRIARATNEAEAEFIQNLLREEGIPSMLRRSRGFDVPDMLAAGRRDVMVPAAGRARAGNVLLQAGIIREAPAPVTLPARGFAALPARWLTSILEFMRIYLPPEEADRPTSMPERCSGGCASLQGRGATGPLVARRRRRGSQVGPRRVSWRLGRGDLSYVASAAARRWASRATNDHP
jgi:hypothetical protein